MWIAEADYKDGTHIEKSFPYYEDGNYIKENERQYEIESWLIEQHPECIWYSVSYIED